jgi:acetolactate synthase-1/2/3 large subunit
VGGKLATASEEKDVPCIAIVGDGAFMMQGSEISTAAQYGIGAVWIVLNDNDLSMVTQGMAVLFPPAEPWDDYYKLGAPDLVKYSEGLGATAIEITTEQTPADFKRALQEAIEGAKAGVPQVIVVHIDTDPMPPYGWPKAAVAVCKETSGA